MDKTGTSSISSIQQEIATHLYSMFDAQADDGSQLMNELIGSSGSDAGGRDTNEADGMRAAEGREFSYSDIVRKELKYTIKLRRLNRGDSDEPHGVEEAAGCKNEAQTQVSEETKKMQQQRRERNRQSAVACRKNRREREKKLKKAVQSLQEENKLLSDRIKKFKQLYRNSLSSMPTKSSFQTYLKAHQDLVRDPDVKPVLREFMTQDYPKLQDYFMVTLVQPEAVS